jgi:hypothetical protein
VGEEPGDDHDEGLAPLMEQAWILIVCVLGGGGSIEGILGSVRQLVPRGPGNLQRITATSELLGETPGTWPKLGAKLPSGTVTTLRTQGGIWVGRSPRSAPRSKSRAGRTRGAWLKMKV